MLCVCVGGGWKGIGTASTARCPCPYTAAEHVIARSPVEGSWPTAILSRQPASWPVGQSSPPKLRRDRPIEATRRTYGVDFHGEIGLCPFYVDADGVRHIAGPELVFLLGFTFPLPLGSVRGGGAGGGEKKSLLVMMLDVRWGVYLWERTRLSGVATIRRSYICQIGINTEKISMAPAQG